MSFSLPPAADRLRRALPYLPGLDGLRAISVIAVLLYHADFPWIPGGFLGVEIFFVISGYLITTLLLSEWEATGRIHPGRFWFRRARRLLPALFTLLIVVGLAARLWLPDELPRLKGDLAAAFTYVTNWYLIVRQESYFEAAGRPSLLKHLWSLAVEEQFYILWPLLLGGLLAVGRKRAAFLATLGLAALSAITMAWLYVPGTDPSRPYYGTDARAAGLLLGAAYAFVWRPWMQAGGVARRTRWLADAFGSLALVGIVILLLRVEESGSFLYRGGFPLLDGLTLALIGAVAIPSGLLARGLGVAPLRWLGLRSYAVYLWHWPVFLVTRGWVDVALDGWALMALRSVVTLALAEMSYRLVEHPIRNGELGRRWQELRARRLASALLPRSRATVPVCLVAGLLVTVGLTSFRLSPAAGAEAGRVLAAPRSALAGQPETAVGKAKPEPKAVTATVTPPGVPSRALAPATVDWPATVTASAAGSGGESVPLDPIAPVPLAPGGGALDFGGRPQLEAATAQATVPPPTRTPPAPGRIFLVGDSVMLGAMRALRERFGPYARIDAEVSRQFSNAPALFRAWRDAGLLDNVVIIHLGSNGAVSSAQFDELMRILQDVPRVYFVTAKVPRRWESRVNEELAAGAARWPNARLIDWHEISYRHRFLFRDDGYHLTPEGAEFYADVLALSVAEDYARGGRRPQELSAATRPPGGDAGSER